MAHVNEDKLAYGSIHDEYALSEKGTPGSPGSPPEQEHIPWTAKRMIAVLALCIVYVGSQIILYFVGAGLTDISKDLNTKLGNWMLTANTLAVAATCPFVGYMTDALGRRHVCIFGIVCLLIASVVVATAHTLATAIVATTIGGIGAGICELTAIAGVAEITPVRWRGVTLAFVTFSIVPFMPYLLYYLLIAQSSSWRWTFCLTGLWNFVGLIGVLFCYFPPPRHNVENVTKLKFFKRLDYVGAFLSIAGVTLFLVGLQAGGYQYPWTSGKTLGPLIVGLLTIIAFCLWEWRGPHKYPMVPKAVFKGQRVVALAFVIVFVAGMDLYSALGFFPIVLSEVYHTSPVTVGIRALSYPCAILVGACTVSFLMSYTKGQVRELFLVPAVLMTAFLGALAVTTPFNPKTAVTMATFGTLGNGGIIVPALTLALYASPDEYIGTVSALSLSSRFLGGSVGTTVYFNVFNGQISKKLPAYIAQAAIAAGLSPKTATAYVTAVLADPTGKAAAAIGGVTPAILGTAQLATQWAFVDSLRYVWYTSIPFGIISCVCCLFLPNIRQYMTNRVAVDIH